MTAQAAPDYFYIFYRTFIYSAPTEPKRKDTKRMERHKKWNPPLYRSLNYSVFQNPNLHFCAGLFMAPHAAKNFVVF